MKIAVCMYGQLRTFHYCQTYLKEFYKDDSEFEIDYFCSVKNYNLGKKDGQQNTFQILSDAKINTISKSFDPKILTTQTYEQDEMFKNVNWKLFTGLADVVFNKRLYEIQNNFEYDLVILQRYDNIVVPLNSLRRIVNYANEFKQNKKHNTPNIIFHFGMAQSNREIYTEIQDLAMIYTGSALELIIADFFAYNKKAQKYRTDFRFQPYPDENIHALIYRLGNKNCVVFEEFKFQERVEPLVVRNGTYINENDILQPSAWEAIKNFWIKTEKSTVEKILKSRDEDDSHSKFG